MEVLPNFIGIGTTRSGSTWLHRNLSEHPEVFLPWAKELHYFDLDENYHNGPDFYEDQFKQHSAEKMIGEITPSYLHTAHVPHRIQQLVPNVRLLGCLRNPIDRAYSHYWRSIAVSPKDAPTVDFFEQIQRIPEIVETGYYARHLSRYLEFFNREQIYIYIFDEISTRPDSVLQGIFDFLEVDSRYQPAYMGHRINAGASLGNLAKFEYLSLLAKIAKRFGRTGASLENRIEIMNRTKLPPMDHQVRQYLERLYSEDVKRLEDIVQLNLSIWNFNQ